jgi:hypothetical protein
MKRVACIFLVIFFVEHGYSQIPGIFKSPSTNRFSIQKSTFSEDLLPELILNDAQIIKQNQISKIRVFKKQYKNDIAVDSFVQSQEQFNKDGLIINRSYLIPHFKNPKTDDRREYDKAVDSFFYDEKSQLQAAISCFNGNYKNVFLYNYSNKNIIERIALSKKLINNFWIIHDTTQITKEYYNESGQRQSLYVYYKKEKEFFKADDFQYDEQGRLTQINSFAKNDQKGLPYFFYKYKRSKIIHLRRTLFRGDIDIFCEYFFNNQSQCFKQIYFNSFSDETVIELQHFYSYNDNGTLKSHTFKINDILNYEEFYTYDLRENN